MRAVVKGIRARLRRAAEASGLVRKMYDPVYADRTVAPEPPGNVFDLPGWVDTVAWQMQSKLAGDGSHRFDVDSYDLAFLGIVAAVAEKRAGPVRILDFGGGIGFSYLALKNGVRDVAYHLDVVETPLNCQRGRALFSQAGNLGFFTEIPSGPYDIILSSSTLQYVPEWKGVLGALAATGAAHMVLTRLPTTEGPSFVAQQNLTMTGGPHKGRFIGSILHAFFNRGEVAAVMGDLGFSVELDLFYSDYGHYFGGARDCTLRTMAFSRSSAASG